MHPPDYAEQNRRAWNQAAPIHAAQKMEGLLEAFRRPGHSVLDPVLTALLRDVGVTGKDVVQLACNNGRELLSVRNLGARRAVGFDISDAFLEQASRLNAAAGLDAEFVRCDLAGVPAEYDRAFDRALVTIGVLGWMADIGAFFSTAARLLRDDGALVVYEMHPVLDMYEGGRGAVDPAPRHSYFDRGPFREEDGLDYYGGTEYRSEPTWYFHHTLGDILSACLAAGFRIEHFREYDHDISNLFADLEGAAVKPPLCYTLVARRT